MLFGIVSCVFGGSGGNDSHAAAPQQRSTVDAPFLAGNPGLQAAHDQDGSGDGFKIIIEMHDSGCWQTVSAVPAGEHRYRVICSRGMTGGQLNFSSYLVDTNTGFTMRTDPG